MPRDIDTVIERVRALHPEATVRQHQVAHVGVDDDGLWFFGIPEERRKDIQVESSTGAAPFLIEHSDMKAGEAFVIPSIDGTVAMVSGYLAKLKRRANKPPEPMA